MRRAPAVPSDGVTALFAAACLIGARLPWPFGIGAKGIFVSLSFLTIVAIVAYAIPVPWIQVTLVCLCFIVLCSTLAARSIDGLHLSQSTLHRDGWRVTLLTDPSWGQGMVSAEGRIDGKHVSIRASGQPGYALARSQAGQTLMVHGRIRPSDHPLKHWMISRHLAGRLSVRTVDHDVDSSTLAWLANAIRSRLLKSARALPSDQRGLYAGFILGDDREQSPALVEDFRASGLSHLLVVSGQNVAFTLAAFEPFIRRLRRRPRLIATSALLLVFTVVTRFEPSVLRAVWMAGVVAIARCLGRPQRGLRVLSLAATSLLVIDPLLSYSVGFGLSLGATVGLAIWSDPLSKRLPLPGVIRSVVAPTLAAQAGAAMVMIPVFGAVPVISVLANVAVVPIAAPLMGWGVVAGLPAGLLGQWAGLLVHVPTRFVLSYVAWAARTAGRLPLGSVGTVPVAGFALATLWACRSRKAPRCTSKRWLLSLGALMAWPSIGALLHPVTDLSGRALTRGATVWASSPSGVAAVYARISGAADVVVVTSEARADNVLAALRRQRYGAVSVLVVANGGRRQAELVRAIGSRVAVGSVLVGDPSFGGGGREVVVIFEPTTLRSGRQLVTLTPSGGGKLVIAVRTG